MKLSTVMTYSDGYTDEVQTTALALGYSNRAIAHLNTRFNLTLPFITDIDADYTAMSDSWFVRFMTDALSYGIKMNDGSLTEAREYKNNFDMSVYEFEGIDRSAVIDEAYLPDDGSSLYVIDTSLGLDIGWFGANDTNWSGW